MGFLAPVSMCVHMFIYIEFLQFHGGFVVLGHTSLLKKLGFKRLFGGEKARFDSVLEIVKLGSAWLARQKARLGSARQKVDSDTTLINTQ